MNRFQNISVLLVLVLFWSCNRNPKNQGTGDILIDTIISHVKDSLSSNLGRDVSESEFYKINDIHIFDLWVQDEGESDDIENRFGFISLSDYFGYSDDSDSLVIPQKYLGIRKMKNEQIQINGINRNRYLAYNDTKETDSVFIFSCTLDTVISYQINEISIVASPNVYRIGDSIKVEQSDYMIGFYLNRKQLGVLADRKDNDINFVYVGKRNPFLTGNVKPVLWQKIDDKAFPSNIRPFNRKGYEKYPIKIGGTFKFITEDLIYFVQMKVLTDNSKSGVGEFEGRHFVVIDANEQIIYEQSSIIQYSSDWGDFYPLRKSINKNSGHFQWTGRIFKNKPSVIYFSDSHPFDCPSIYFLDSKEPPIVIGCDNRH